MIDPVESWGLNYPENTDKSRNRRFGIAWDCAPKSGGIINKRRDVAPSWCRATQYMTDRVVAGVSRRLRRFCARRHGFN